MYKSMIRVLSLVVKFMRRMLGILNTVGASIYTVLELSRDICNTFPAA